MSVLKLAADVLNPATLKHLRAAGSFDLKTPAALARSVPWILGRGVSLGLVCRMHALTLGDKVAVIDRNGEVTWGDLDARVNRACRLIASFGLAGGDRVALLLRNSLEMVELLLAGQKLGVTMCPLNTWAGATELRTTLERAAPDLLVYEHRHAEQLAAAGSPTVGLLVVGDETSPLPGARGYERSASNFTGDPLPPLTRHRGSPEVVIHTSGTSGKPKGASRKVSSGLGAAASLFSVVPYHRTDVVYCAAPMFHSFGLATFTFATLLGATLVLPERFDAETALADIEKHGVTAASFVPVMIRRILDLPKRIRDRYDLSSLRIVLVSGSALSDDMRRQAMELFGPVLYDLYGSTELGWVAIATPQDMLSRPGTVGRAMPGVHVEVAGEDGTILSKGARGRLLLKGVVEFEGYTTGEDFPGVQGFLEIGDAGFVDEDGYIHIEGRADDMVVVGGENVYPAEIEAVIESINGVVEAAVFGTSDPEYGQVLVACVEGAVSEDEVIERCRAELASYKVPRKVVMMETLPRTGTGKVKKRDLQESL